MASKKQQLIKKENLTLPDLFRELSAEAADGQTKYFSLAAQSTMPFLDMNRSFTSYGNQLFKRWGNDNLYPNHLENLYQSSPTNSSLINLKTTLTVGDGFLYDEANTDLTAFIDENNLEEVFECTASDFVKYGGFALLIYWNAGASIGMKPEIARIEHCDISLLRPEEKMKVENYYYSPDWRNDNHPENQMVKIPAFNPELAGQQSPQVLYYIKKKDGNHYLPKEDYRSAIKSIALEGEIQNFWLNNVCNGMVPSGIFTLTQVPDAEQREAVKQRIKKDFTSTDNAGKFLVLFSEDGKNQPSFIPISTSNNADIYNALSQQATQKILSSHQLNSPALAGLPGNGSIFTNEISTAFEYFYNITIKKNYQNPLMRVFNQLFAINGLTEKGKVGIKSLNPIQFVFSENVLMNVLTKNELRENMGFAPLEGGNETPMPPAQTINITPGQIPSTDLPKKIKVPPQIGPAPTPQSQITGR